MTTIGSYPRALLLDLHVLAMGALAAPVPALAMQILDAADLYLRPAGAQAATPGAEAAGYEPATLFIGTEKGFTYRLTLTPAARDSAQILIRNVDAVPSSAAFAASPSAGETHVAAVVRLLRAVAGREALPGIAIHAGGGSLGAGIRLIETW